MDHQSLVALITLLEQENAIYSEMAVLLEEERKAMLAMAMDLLGEIASRKETLALRIKALDESRKMLARRLGLALGIAADNVTIQALSEAAPAQVGERLRQAGQTLKETVLHCQEINNYNARAATQGRSLVSGAIEFLIAQADPAGKLYQAPGKAKGYGGAMRRPGAPGFISRQA